MYKYPLSQVHWWYKQYQCHIMYSAYGLSLMDALKYIKLLLLTSGFNSHIYFPD